MDHSYRIEAVLWLSCFATAFMDLGTTWVGLTSGYVEKNPFGSHMIEQFGFSSLLITKSVIIIIVLGMTELIPKKKWRYMPPILLSSVWLIAFLLNSYTLI